MLKTVFTRHNLFLLVWIIFVSLFFGILTYRQLLLVDRGTLNVHLNFTERMMAGEPLKQDGTLDNLPHVAYFYSLIALTKLGFNLEQAAIIILTIAHLLAFLITYKLYWHFLEKSLDLNFVLLGAFVSLCVASIYLPFFNANSYFGAYSPNTHHNSTVILLKPFATFAFFMIIGLFKSEKFQLKWLTVASLVFMLSVIIKPTFAIVFVPALGVWLLFNPHFKKNIFLALVIVLPSLLIILSQYFYYYEAADHHRSITIAPFAIWTQFTPNIAVSILQALAFPLVLTGSRWSQLKFPTYVIIAYIMVVIGIIQFVLFAEMQDENLLYTGNWAGGYLMGLSLLYTVSILEFIDWLKDYSQLTQLQRIFVILCLTLLLVHLISGLLYDLELFNKGVIPIP